MIIKNLREDIRFREYQIDGECYIPRRLYPFLSHAAYKDITWQTMTLLYRKCVELVRISYNVPILVDIPYGKGFMEVKCLFFKELEKIRFRIEKEKMA